jgi:hypothetical protein
MNISQTDDSIRITTEQNISLINALSNTTKNSRTGELVVGIIVSEKPKEIFFK